MSILQSTRKRVNDFINDPENTKYIKYDWDGGHAYSYIDHELMVECEDVGELECQLTDWLYNHEDCPPCEIHIKRDKSGKIVETSSSCGCHDDLDTSDQEYIEDIVSDLKDVSPKWGVTEE